jgi:hypothetical protein
MESQALDISSHHPVLIDRAVYGTITLMSMLIIYDGWQNLRLVDVIGVVVGPVVAMFLGHVFSKSVSRQVVLGRSLTRREQADVVRIEARFLLLCVPPVTVISVCVLLGISLSESIRIALWMGVASLGLWCGLAARRAGFTGWRLARSMLAGVIVGLVVLSLQVLLRPGTAT